MTKQYKRKTAIIAKQVRLTAPILQRLRNDVFKGSVTETAKRTGLPYMLIYNLVHARVASISGRHYRMLFKEEPPPDAVLKVDGAYFRALVDLYLYLRGDATKADLYREFYGEHHPRKVDYRIFNGQTATVDARLVEMLETKFLESGVDRSTLRGWLVERDSSAPADRLPYGRLRPALLYLKEVLGVHPTFLLNQIFDRYETGQLRSVSRKTFERIHKLKQQVDTILSQGGESERKLLMLREALYGAKPGYTLFLEIREELDFLEKYADISPKRYLGRGRRMYDNGQVKRIPTRRAAKIKRDCEAFIQRNPDLPLSVLPTAYRNQRIAALISALVVRTADLLGRKEGIAIEKKILKPASQKTEYEKEAYGFTRVEQVPSVLGMDKKAFDLMVAMNCEIFKSIGRHTRRWYFSDLYLKELKQKDTFDFVKVKYELMARSVRPTKPVDACLN